MDLVNNRSYFVSVTDAVLRADARTSAAPLNHLLFGDWLKYLGEEKNGWARVRSRNTTGWLRKKWFQEERILEVNFVDIGQGDGCHIVTPDDEVILIDAGVGDNMYRFVSWRYNLRRRKVAGIDGVAAGDPGVLPPFKIGHVVISHPDKDHYRGFRPIFECGKLSVQRIYHSGAVERTIRSADKQPGLRYFSKDDLGGYVKGDSGDWFLWDVVTSNAAMHQLIRAHKGTTKQYLETLEAAVVNNGGVRFTTLTEDDGFVQGFGEGASVELKVLGPLTEKVTHDGKSKRCLIRLGNEGVTKNGHSVILQLRIGRLRIMLGGDLNTESEDYLLRHYADATADASKLETLAGRIRSKGPTASPDELQTLAEAEAQLRSIVTNARRHFQVDVTKACHHGSHHFSETFLKALNAIVTVISSGDEESYAHPRPDALGSFGKYGRGVRPLIFSTELARSTKEFTPVREYFEKVAQYNARIAAARTQDERDRLETELDEKKDRNVAVYGMITLRTDGERVVLAQKLEVAGGNDNKWDIHELRFNEHLAEFEYVMAGKGH